MIKVLPFTKSFKSSDHSVIVEPDSEQNYPLWSNWYKTWHHLCENKKKESSK